MGYSHWTLVSICHRHPSQSHDDLPLNKKAMVGTDGYGSQAHGYPKTNRNAGSRLAQPRFGREESIKDAWHARDRCLSRSRTAMWMRPAAQPHDVPSLSWGHHAFSTLIMRAYRHPEFRTNRQCIASSPPLACFCDVCAAQILSELELGNNLAARSPNSMISRSLNDRCANCSIYDFDVL